MSTETINEHAGAEERATRCARWWIAGNYNDGEATCRRWEAMAREAAEEIEVEEFDRDAVTYNLGNALKDWMEEERGDVHGTPFDDMLGYMMACVDWQQLASDAIEEELRQRA